MKSDGKGKKRKPPTPRLPIVQRVRPWRGKKREEEEDQEEDVEYVDEEEEDDGSAESGMTPTYKKNKKVAPPVVVVVSKEPTVPAGAMVLRRLSGDRVSHLSSKRVTLIAVSELLLNILSDHPIGSTFNLKEQATLMGTTKRRVQDIFSVFLAVGLLTRPFKSTGLWMGYPFMQKHLQDSIAPMSLAQHASDIFGQDVLSMYQVACFMAACILKGVFEIGDSPKVVLAAVTALIASPNFSGQIMTEERNRAFMRRMYDVAAILAPIGGHFQLIAPSVVAVTTSSVNVDAEVVVVVSQQAQRAREAAEIAKRARAEALERQRQHKSDMARKKRAQTKLDEELFQNNETSRRRLRRALDQFDEGGGGGGGGGCNGGCRCCVLVKETKLFKVSLSAPQNMYGGGEEDSTTSARASVENFPVYYSDMPLAWYEGVEGAEEGGDGIAMDLFP